MLAKRPENSMGSHDAHPNPGVPANSQGGEVQRRRMEARKYQAESGYIPERFYSAAAAAAALKILCLQLDEAADSERGATAAVPLSAKALALRARRPAVLRGGKGRLKRPLPPVVAFSLSVWWYQQALHWCSARAGRHSV